MTRRLYLIYVLFILPLSLLPSISCKQAKNDFIDPSQIEMIELIKLDSTFMLDVRYATSNNFTGKKIYPEARVFLEKESAEALVRVHQALKKKGFRLKMFDGYRPLSAQKILWATKPDERYVADPQKGSRHNRGMAVDLTLTDMKGREVPMPTGYDEFSQKAHRNFMDLPSEVILNRKILEEAMEGEGFVGLPTEWWHFDFKGWERYPILDLSFDEIEKKM